MNNILQCSHFEGSGEKDKLNARGQVEAEDREWAETAQHKQAKNKACTLKKKGN